MASDSANCAFRLHEATVSFASLARILDGARKDPAVLQSGTHRARRVSFSDIGACMQTCLSIYRAYAGANTHIYLYTRI